MDNVPLLTDFRTALSFWFSMACPDQEIPPTSHLTTIREAKEYTKQFQLSNRCIRHFVGCRGEGLELRLESEGRVTTLELVAQPDSPIEIIWFHVALEGEVK